MLEDAKAAAPLGTKVVAVTTLTSLDDRDLKTIGVDRAPGEQVLHLTELAMASGIDGIVCSGAEVADARRLWRSEEHTSELQSLMRNSYAVFCLKQKTTQKRA